MPRKKQAKQFKQLQAKWYAKLSKSGFEDIEANDNKLKRYDAEYFLSTSVDKAMETLQYYKQCEEFLREHNFFSKSDRGIWRLHCTGMTEEEIAKHFGVNQSTISRILGRIHKVMQDDRSDNN